MYCALTALFVATGPVGHDPGGDVAGLAPRGRVALLLVGRLLGPATPVGEQQDYTQFGLYGMACKGCFSETT